MKNILIILLFISTNLLAIVSIKPIEIQDKEEIKTEIGVELNFKTGNSDVTNSSISIKTINYGKNYANMLVIDDEYGESSGKKNTEKSFVHFRHIIASSHEYINYELLAQLQKDTFKSIKSKKIIGAVVRYKVSLEKTTVMFFGLGLLETRLNENYIYSNYESIDTYLSYNYKIDKKIKLTYNGYYQPLLNNFEDYEINQKIQWLYKLTDSLNITFNLTHTYDSTPALGIKKYDLSSKIGISYNF